MLVKLRFIYYKRIVHIKPTNFEKLNVSKAAQLLSDSVAHTLRRYKRNKKFAYLFKGSETTKRFTKLINDVFDAMNGRCIAQGINVINGWKKKKRLDIFLDILEEEEECKRTRKPNDPDTPVKMFLSDTTLQSWRVTVLRVRALTEEMFNVESTSVLTGKLNQDPLESVALTTHRPHILGCKFLGYCHCTIPQGCRPYASCKKEVAQIRESFKEQL
ncbi:Uncharacterized protein APZ42_034258 [Daphnia magna]|uniref:Transposable element P transposase-like GTP-binding insertion domain-containing protein n=1 Tax=Daphnia magna TaxID=35525 RepID=A0A164KAN4_9CRUS|nr:Uncharacterized protein APZ42_034258 [Daphnia magna]